MIPGVSAGSKSPVLESRMPKMFRTKTILPGGHINGVLELPGDKSISHRYAILAALAEGRSEILNYSSAADCKSTLGCFRLLCENLNPHPPPPPNPGTGLHGLQ